MFTRVHQEYALRTYKMLSQVLENQGKLSEKALNQHFLGETRGKLTFRILPCSKDPFVPISNIYVSGPVWASKPRNYQLIDRKSDFLTSVTSP